MRKMFLLGGIVLLALIGGLIIFLPKHTAPALITNKTETPTPTPFPGSLNGLRIDTMRKIHYPGSNITIQQTLTPGGNYNQYIASYLSDGNSIYALLTVPFGQKPKDGWPVILLNHGYIPPSEYNTVSSYAGITDALASAGYIVFKPDYRGNGNSQGEASQIYISPGYTADSMNALSSIAKYKDANPQRIGVWGHSMGGNVTLHELVITHQLKAAVIWAGVVGNWTQIFSWWKDRIAQRSITGNDLHTADIIEQILSQVGTPDQNSKLWNSLDPTYYLSSISTPVQIDVGTADTTVPPEFSVDLASSLQKMGKTVEFYSYSGADHNLTPDGSLAMERTITFFNKYLK